MRTAEAIRIKTHSSTVAKQNFTCPNGMQNKSNAFFVKEYKNSIPQLDTNYEILFGNLSLAYIVKKCKKKEQVESLLTIY